MDKEIINIVIAGHVDHGKSTLIGRVIYDTGSIAEDRLAVIRAASGSGKDIDFAFLTDQLREERKNLMTIDTSQMRFSVGKRDYLIIDSPGHVEFTKNMITGATHADFGILLVSAVEGIEEQTKRHAYILNMLGMKKLLVLINKMDLAGYDEAKFNAAAKNTEDFLRRIGTKMLVAIPISAMKGDNIVRPSKNMRWYRGNVLIPWLGKFKKEAVFADKPMRFAVQDIYDIGGERIFAGRVESGTIREKEDVLVLPANTNTAVKEIKVFGGKKKSAEEGENIGIILANDKDVSPGGILSDRSSPAMPKNSFHADVFWLADSPMLPGEDFILRCASQEAQVSIDKIEKRIDPSTLETIEEGTRSVGTNEIGKVLIVSSKPVVVEDFSFTPGLGRFILENASGVQGAGIVRS